MTRNAQRVALDMFNVILLAIFFVSLGIVCWIVFGAFPVLSRIAVDEHPKIRESKTKRALLFGRWERSVRGATARMGERFSPFFQRIHGLVARWSEHVLLLERKYGVSRVRRPKKMMGRSVDEEIHLLLERGRTELADGRAERAEKTYVDILRLESRNVEAYWGLVGVYRELRANREVLETLHFLTRLLPEDAEVWYELARASYAAENLPDMLEAILHAVSLEGANPKYLDFLCEAAILNGRRDIAADAFERLQAANPENQKLGELRKRINELQ